MNTLQFVHLIFCWWTIFWVRLLEIFLYKSFSGHMFSFLLRKYLRVNLLGHKVELNFMRSLPNSSEKWLFHFILQPTVCFILQPRFQVLHILVNTFSYNASHDNCNGFLVVLPFIFIFSVSLTLMDPTCFSKAHSPQAQLQWNNTQLKFFEWYPSHNLSLTSEGSLWSDSYLSFWFYLPISNT